MVLWILASWVLGLTAFMVALFGGPAASLLEGYCRPRWMMSVGHLSSMVLEKPLSRTALKFLGCFCIFIPLALLFAMGIVSLADVACTGWTSSDCFWSALPNVSSGAATIYAGPEPAKEGVWLYVLTVTSSMGFFVLSVAVYISEDIFDVVWDRTGAGVPRSRGGGVALLVAFSALGIPALVVLLSVPLGGLLAWAEDWAFMDGFWWSVSAQLGGGLSMVDVKFARLGGRLVGTLAAAGSIGQSVLSVELSGAPVMEPVMELLGMTLPDLEEIELDLWGPTAPEDWALDLETNSSRSSGGDERGLAQSPAASSAR